MTDTDLFSLDAPANDLGNLLVDTTGYDGRFVVVHTLTTMVDVNPNRDFEGLPKQTTYGGVDRLRISPQSRLRAARVWTREFLGTADQAARTRSLPGAVREILVQRYDHDPAEAGHTAAALVASTGMGIDWGRPDLTTAIMFVPTAAATQLADLAHKEWDSLAEARDAARDMIAAALGGKKTKGAKKGKKPEAAEAPEGTDADSAEPAKDDAKDAKFDAKLVPAAVSKLALGAFDAAGTIDIALYGRMLANIARGGVDSAVQVADSVSVDRYSDILDEFTVVDDWQADDVFGSANMGRQYLASGTLYGYAALDRHKLRKTLEGGHPDPVAAARLAEQVFVSAMAWSMPSGKRTRTGSTVLPTLVLAGGTDMALSAAPAFEQPVDTPAGVAAAHRLCEYISRMTRRATLYGGVASWISPDGSPAPELPKNVTLD